MSENVEDAGSAPQFQRPFRAVGIFFACLSPLVAVPAAIYGIYSVEFLEVLAYILFLPLFGVGIALAHPGRLVKWWLRGAVLLPLGMIGFKVWLLSDPVSAIEMFPLAGFLILLKAYLLTGCVIAAWGWVRYVRWYRSAGRTSRTAAPKQ